MLEVEKSPCAPHAVNKMQHTKNKSIMRFRLITPVQLILYYLIKKPGKMQAMQQKRTKPKLGLLCLRNLFSRLGQAIVLPREVSGGHFQADAPYVIGKKKDQAVAWSFVFALPIFTARASYRPAAGSVRWTLPGRCALCHWKEKGPSRSLVLCVCVTYFHGQSPGNYRRRTCA